MIVIKYILFLSFLVFSEELPKEEPQNSKLFETNKVITETKETLTKVKKIFDNPTSVTLEELEEVRDKLKSNLDDLNKELEDLNKKLENATDEEREEIEKKIEELNSAIYETKNALSFINSEIESMNKTKAELYYSQKLNKTTTPNFDFSEPTPHKIVFGTERNENQSTSRTIVMKSYKRELPKTITMEEERPITLVLPSNAQVNTTLSISSSDEFFSKIQFNKKDSFNKGENKGAAMNENILKNQQKKISKNLVYTSNNYPKENTYSSNVNFEEIATSFVATKNSIRTVTINTVEPLALENSVKNIELFYENEFEDFDDEISKDVYLKTVQKEKKTIIKQKVIPKSNFKLVSNIDDLENYTYNSPSKTEIKSESKKKDESSLPKWLMAFSKEIFRGLTSLKK